jgi:hypothetical protein
MAVNLGFLDRSHYFLFNWLLSYPHEAVWTPLKTHCFSENVLAPGIEPGTSGLLDNRGGIGPEEPPGRETLWSAVDWNRL